jgi:hypothetical protein
MQAGWVYFLWGERTTSFKIGWTSESVAKRAAIIEAYSAVPLRVMGAIGGTLRDERALHHALRKYRTHGEWFDLPEAVVWRLLRVFGAEGSW